MKDDAPTPCGRTLALGALVLLGGFAVMVLEIVGARYLQPWFGGAFYVWTSQIGIVMLALALGYGVGGHLADRFKKARFLSLLLAPAGIFILLIPQMAPGMLDGIVDRHVKSSASARSAEPTAPEAVRTGSVITETNLLAEIPKDFLEGKTNNAANNLPAPPIDEAPPSEIPAVRATAFTVRPRAANTSISACASGLMVFLVVMTGSLVPCQQYCAAAQSPTACLITAS